jgi:hypothetical protein
VWVWEKLSIQFFDKRDILISRKYHLHSVSATMQCYIYIYNGNTDARSLVAANQTPLRHQ